MSLRQFDGGVYLCARCKPASDAVGFGMHAEHAAKMRAHLAEKRALNAGTIPRPVDS